MSNIQQYPYHIADNFFIYQILQLIKYIAINIYHDEWIENECDKLRESIYIGIHSFGVYHDEHFGDIYYYEVDDKYNCNLMDDANIPSLSIPMITNQYNHTIYNNTRQWLLSDANPYFYQSKLKHNVQGIGSPHTPNNYVWPLALITQGFTYQDKDELNKYQILQMLIRNTGNTGLMHEGFDVDNDKKYTRKFFSWANSYFSIYANCKQFIDLESDYVKSLIQQKAESDGYIGSLSTIQEVFSGHIQRANPKFIQWIKKCEAEEKMQSLTMTD